MRSWKCWYLNGHTKAPPVSGEVERQTQPQVALGHRTKSMGQVSFRDEVMAGFPPHVTERQQQLHLREQHQVSLQRAGQCPG